MTEPRAVQPSQAEIEAAVSAMHGRALTVPVAIVLALITAGTSLGVAYLTIPRPAHGEPASLPANVATQADVREVREDVAQLRREFRAWMADVDARQGRPGPPASARP